MNSRSVKKAVVVEYQKRRKPTKHYVYVINVTWSDNSVVVIFRRYSNFFDLQTKLFEEFPDEGGIKDPSLRSLPFLPGKIIFGRSNIRDVAEKRKEPINDYCQSLIKLPAKISQSYLVVDFFEPTNEDIASMQPQAEQKNTKDAREEKGKVISEPMQLEQYIVIADYQKQNRSEVSVLAGDIVEVIEKNENGWWFVNMDEEQGWVPASYLEPEDGSVESSVTTTFKPGEERFIASSAYKANEPDEIGFQKGVVVDVLQKNIDGWWLVRYNGKDGWAPSIYLKKLDPNQALPNPHGYENVTLSNEHALQNKPRKNPNRNEGGGNQSSKPPPRKSSVRKSHKLKNRVRTPSSPREGSVSSFNEAEYVTLSDYRAQGFNGGLSVEKGVSVHIIEKSPNGWWYCKTGENEGWVPSSYIERRERREKQVNQVTKPAVASRPAALGKTVIPKPTLPKPVVAKPVATKPGGKKPGVPKPVPGKRDAEGFNYIVICDYCDRDNLNISLKEGAQVKVLEKRDSGWWYVQSSGAEGWAPSTYLTEKPKPKRPQPPSKVNIPPITARQQANRPPPARPSPPARPTNPPSGRRRGAAGPPIPSRGQKPTLPRKNNFGSVENLRVKPAVALKQAHSIENLISRTQYYYVIADFSDEMNEDTLEIKQGERIEVTKRDEGGWWLAKKGNQTGWVPSNYLEQ